MNDGLTYNYVKDKLKAEYEYGLKSLQVILNQAQDEIDVDDVETRLGVLASMKMKLDILDAAGLNLINSNPNQKLLFD